jgi:hypothetical protein
MEPIDQCSGRGSHYFEQDPHPHFFEARSWIRIRIKVKSWIRARIRIKVMRIRKPAFYKNKLYVYLKKNILANIKKKLLTSK